MQTTSRNYQVLIMLWKTGHYSHDLKALPLVHFLSVLLLKEQMTTSVRKTLKTLIWSAQNRLISSEICRENSHKIGCFYRLLFGKVCPEISREILGKLADFSLNLCLKIPGNLTFFSVTYQKPCVYVFGGFNFACLCYTGQGECGFFLE